MTECQISSSVASAWIRSSWRSMRLISPSTRAPPSNEMLRRRLSRSRSRNSASPAMVEEAQQPRHGRAQLTPVDDHVELAEAEVRLRLPEVLGQLLAGDRLDDARAAEREE